MTNNVPCKTKAMYLGKCVSLHWELKTWLKTKNCAKRHIRPLYVNFEGDIFFVFGLVPSVAQLSSAFYYFLCFHAAAYVHLDA